MNINTLSATTRKESTLKNKFGRIVIIGFYDDKNLGDLVISDCALYFFRKQFPQRLLKRVSLNEVNRCKSFNIFERFLNLFLRILRKFHIDTSKLIDSTDSLLISKCLDSLLEHPDIIVIGGGGLIKFNYQFFGTQIHALTLYAEKRNIPILYYSVGVEGFEAKSWKCQILKKCLNSKNVQYISTRDDFNTLKQFYIHRSSITVENVCDPATWAAEIYGISRVEGSNILGINVSHGKLFKNYGIHLDEEAYLNLFRAVIEDQYSKHPIVIYTNGCSEDNDFAFLLQDELKKNKIKVTVEIPHNGKELVEIISHFQCILATRLHSSIIAYSLNIPAVAMEWNKKVVFWGDSINSKYIVNPENFNTSFICRKIDKAIVYGYDKNKREAFRNTIQNSMKTIHTLFEN